jgi:hypothetical protein
MSVYGELEVFKLVVIYVLAGLGWIGFEVGKVELVELAFLVGDILA